MTSGQNNDPQRCKEIRRSFAVAPVSLGAHWAYNLANDPKRILFVLSRYKFSARIGLKKGRVLELGCSEGIGAPILGEFATSYTGVDLDGRAIATARKNWQEQYFSFIKADFLNRNFGAFDLVVSMDVLEHIAKEQEHLFFESVHANLHPEGVCVIGTPNISSATYASEASRRGHINLFDGKRLRNWMERLCHNVFLFSMNDEIVHTGFEPMAHYLIAVGCNRREGITS